MTDEEAMAKTPEARLAYYIASLDKGRRPFSDEFSARVIAEQVAEISRLEGVAQREIARRIAAEQALNAALAAEPAPALGRAAADVIAERRRQIEDEGFIPNADDNYFRGELARAAACYAHVASIPGSARAAIPEGWPTAMWPWAAKWWKPSTPRRDLVKAGALILAEIDRIDRAEAADADDGDFIHSHDDDEAIDRMIEGNAAVAGLCPDCGGDGLSDVAKGTACQTCDGDGKGGT